MSQFLAKWFFMCKTLSIGVATGIPIKAEFCQALTRLLPSFSIEWVNIARNLIYSTFMRVLDKLGKTTG